MLIGTLAIANDLLGIVTDKKGNCLTITDKTGTPHVVQKSVVHEIANPHAISYLLLNQVAKRGGK